MSLAIKPDEIDRSGPDETTNAADDIFAELFDPDYAEHNHSSLPSVGTLLGGTASNSSLAGIDDATALRWQYEDKMVVMGLVLGTFIICLIFAVLGLLFHRRLKLRKSAQESGEATGQVGPPASKSMPENKVENGFSGPQLPFYSQPYTSNHYVEPTIPTAIPLGPTAVVHPYRPEHSSGTTEIHHDRTASLHSDSTSSFAQLLQPSSSSETSCPPLLPSLRFSPPDSHLNKTLLDVDRQPMPIAKDKATVATDDVSHSSTARLPDNHMISDNVPAPAGSVPFRVPYDQRRLGL